MTCGVYKITNLINGKVYIGKSIHIEKRIREHRYIPNDNMAIHKAMKKYGAENFSYDILEECSEEELDEKESLWIDYYDSYLGEGYNSAPGGEGASHPVKVTNELLLLIIDDLQNNLKISIKEIANKYNVSTKTISDINNGYSRRINDLSYPLRKNCFACSAIDLDKLTNLLNKTMGDFDLIASMFGVSSMTIRSWCKKYNLPTTRKSYGFVDKQTYHSIAIEQYNKETKELICRYDSIAEACRILNINKKAVSKALHSKSHISNGYIWKTCSNCTPGANNVGMA